MTKNREIFNKLLKYLELPEIIVIHGARQVGKTTLMKMVVDFLKKKSEDEIFFFDLERIEHFNLCNKGINEIISYIKVRKKGITNNRKIYIFIDEIQYLDNPSSLLKLFYDDYKNSVKLIVSGSSSFALKSKFKDSLVGRILDFELFGLSFKEYLDFKNLQYDLSIRSELSDKEIGEHYKDYCLYGFYPQVVLADSIELKEIYLSGIIEKYIYKDIRDIANIRDIKKFNTLLSYLASQVCCLVNTNELSGTLKISRQTIEEYLIILENTFIIKMLKPYYRNLRGELSKMPKVFFEDNGVLNLLKHKNINSNLDGALFENSIYAILRRIHNVNNVNFWRSTSKQEVDFVVTNDNVTAREVKFGRQRKLPSSLNSFKSKYPHSDIGIITLEKNSGLKEKQLFPWELL